MIATKEQPLRRRFFALPALALTAACLGLAACGGPVQVRGNMPEVEDVAALEPGVHSRQDVADLLGSPSTVSTFQDRKWYYIGQKTQEFAFLKPEVLDRKVLVVTFDEAGYVDQTTSYSLADAQEIQPVERITPTEGKDLTLLQQLFGNLGRFGGSGSN